MGSSYPPDQSIAACQRCGSPLFPDEAHCRTCGFVSIFPQQQSFTEQISFPSHPTHTISQTAQEPLPPRQNAAEHKQPRGLLGRYGASSGQDSSNVHQGNQGWQVQQNYNGFAFPPAQVQQMPQTTSFEQSKQRHYDPDTPPVLQASFSKAPFQPGVAENASQQSPFVMPQQNLPFSQQAQQLSWRTKRPMMNEIANNVPAQYPITPKKQRLKVGMTVSIVLLLVAVIGVSTLGYLYLTRKLSSGNTTIANTRHQVAMTPTAPSLFSDNFTDNTHQWSLQSYPGQFSVSIQNSALALESDNNKLLWEIVPGNQTYGNFQLSVDAVLSKGSQENGYGIYFRSTLDQTGALATYYRFELYGDGTFALFKSGTDANATPTRLVDYTATSAIQKQGTVNHITIFARGQTLQLSVNGSVLSTVTDASYTSGAIALFVSNLQNAPAGAQVQFSHLAIYPAQ